MPERHIVTVELDIELDADDVFGVVPVVDEVIRSCGIPTRLAEAGATATRLSYNTMGLPEG